MSCCAHLLHTACPHALISGRRRIIQAYRTSCSTFVPNVRALVNNFHRMISSTVPLYPRPSGTPSNSRSCRAQTQFAEGKYWTRTFPEKSALSPLSSSSVWRYESASSVPSSSSSSSSSPVERRGRVVVVPRPPRFWSSLHPPLLLLSNSWCSRALCFGFPGLVALGKASSSFFSTTTKRKEKARGALTHDHHAPPPPPPLVQASLVFSGCEQRVLSRVVNVSLSFREDETFLSRGENPKKNQKP